MVDKLSFETAFNTNVQRFVSMIKYICECVVNSEKIQGGPSKIYQKLYLPGNCFKRKPETRHLCFCRKWYNPKLYSPDRGWHLPNFLKRK